MKKRLLEGSVLFISILKWLFLASCTGVIVGLSTAKFIKSLEFCSLLFIEMLKYIDRISKRIEGLIGGILLIALSLIFSTRYLGLGLETIKGTIEGNPVPSGAPVLKMLFTSVTLIFYGSGGIITPIFFIGSTAGSVFGGLLGFSPSIFSTIGMVSLLAGAANTLISASIMAVELFGPRLLRMQQWHASSVFL